MARATLAVLGRTRAALADAFPAGRGARGPAGARSPAHPAAARARAASYADAG